MSSNTPSDNGGETPRQPAASKADPDKTRTEDLSVSSINSTVASSSASSILDGIAASTSSLFRSFHQTSPGEASSALHAHQSTKQHPQIPRALSSLTAEASSFQDNRLALEQSGGSAAGSSCSNADQGGFRTGTRLVAGGKGTAEADFHNFTRATSSVLLDRFASVPTPPDFALPVAPPQEDIFTMLSSSTISAVWQPDPIQDTIPPASRYRTDAQNPYFEAFLGSDDIVEFLSRNDGVYTEEVWGDLLPLVQEAKKELEEDRKGKGKEDVRENGNAVERLKMVWSHLKSKI